MRYAQVIALKKIGDFDNGLTYGIPESVQSELGVGFFVKIPFRNSVINGMVTEINNDLPAGIDKDKIKEIVKIIPDIFLSAKQIALAQFISSYYRTSMGRAVKLFLPKQIWNGNFKQPINLIYKIISNEPDLRGIKQKEIFEKIKQKKNSFKEFL